MAIAVTATNNALATAYEAQGSWLSLHTASPAATGANEVLRLMHVSRLRGVLPLTLL